MLTGQDACINAKDRLISVWGRHEDLHVVSGWQAGVSVLQKYIWPLSILEIYCATNWAGTGPSLNWRKRGLPLERALSVLNEKVVHVPNLLSQWSLLILPRQWTFLWQTSRTWTSTSNSLRTLTFWLQRWVYVNISFSTAVLEQAWWISSSLFSP